MTPETLDTILFGIFLVSITIAVVIACLLGITIVTYFSIKWIYTDFNKSFKNNKKR